jgi:hypothetical protein
LEKSARSRQTWLLCLGILVLLHGTAAGGPVSITCRSREAFAAAESLRVVHLSQRFVIAASDSVSLGQVLLARDKDYRMDYAEGMVYLLRSPAGEDSLFVSYAHLPPGLKPSYCLRPVGRRLDAGAECSDQDTPPVGRPRSYDLKASGSKTISVETGTLKDLRINQSLNLSLGGTIGKDVEVRGVLSDRDVTFDDAGSTARLKDLDRIFMEVRSPNAYARVGDLEIDESPGDLLRFRRTMTGFLGNASYGSKEFTASGAASRSTYETVELRGREGIAGPYCVTGRDGERADIVKRSDRVWLDGRELVRGSEADYTIDYTLAEIYFNPRHIIGDDARIVVDYESQSNDDRRQFYFARSALDVGSKATVALSFVNEGYSPTESDPLVGDSSTQPILGTGDGDWVDGGRFVGAGKGDYVKVHMDSVVYYEYVGSGLGDHQVTFTKVGTDEGRYSYVFSEEFDAYIHLYTGRGDYTDMVRALPRVKSRVVHMKATAQPLPWMELESEAARSEGHCEQPGDVWRLESDQAYTVELKAGGDLPAVGGVSLGSVDFDAGRRAIGPYYIGFDRLRRPDFLEFWAQDPPDGFEKSNHAGLTHRIGDRIRTSFEMGSLETGAGDSRRYRAGLDLGDNNLGASASSQVARMITGETSRGSERYAVELRVPIKPVRLAVGRNDELRERLRDSTSVRRAEYYSRAELAGGYGSVQIAFSTISEERDAGSGWLDYSAVQEGSLEFETRAGKALALRGGLSQRRTSYAEDVGLGEHRATGADLHMNLRDVSIVSSMSMDYRLANTLSTLYANRLVKVEGGDYDSLGNYRPDAGGYVLSRYETGMRPVTSVKAGFTLELGRKGKIILDRSLSTRTVVDIEGETSGGPIERVALLQTGYLINSPNAVYGSVDLRQEVVFRRSRALTVWLSVRGLRLSDGRCLGRREEKNLLELYGRILSSGFKGTTVRLEGKTSRTESEWLTETGRLSPTRRMWLAKLDVERTMMPGLDGRMKLELTDEDRTEPRSQTLETRFGPGLTLFAGPLRCDADLGIRRMLRAETEVAAAPRRDSIDWNSRVNTRHGRHTSISVEYSGHKYSGLAAVHSARVSLSAAF